MRVWGLGGGSLECFLGHPTSGQVVFSSVWGAVERALDLDSGNPATSTHVALGRLCYEPLETRFSHV